MVRFPKANEPRFLFRVGRSELMVAAFRLAEKISSPFAAELELASEDEIQFDDMVGKVGLLTLGALNIVMFHTTIDRQRQEWDAAETPPFRARLAGLLSLILWFSIIAAGRIMAYNL